MLLRTAAMFALAAISALAASVLGTAAEGGVHAPLTSAQSTTTPPAQPTAKPTKPAQLAQPAQPAAGVGGVRRGRGYRDWRTRGDPTLINSLWRSRQPLGIRKQLGNAEVYIVLALLIGFVTVVVGCWLSDNCWSPDPEEAVVLP